MSRTQGTDARMNVRNPQNTDLSNVALITQIRCYLNQLFILCSTAVSPSTRVEFFFLEISWCWCSAWCCCSSDVWIFFSVLPLKIGFTPPLWCYHFSCCVQRNSQLCQLVPFIWLTILSCIIQHVNMWLREICPLKSLIQWLSTKHLLCYLFPTVWLLHVFLSELICDIRLYENWLDMSDCCWLWLKHKSVFPFQLDTS